MSTQHSLEVSGSSFFSEPAVDDRLRIRDGSLCSFETSYENAPTAKCVSYEHFPITDDANIGVVVGTIMVVFFSHYCGDNHLRE